MKPSPKQSSSKTVNPTSEPTTKLQGQIRGLAYELYEQRGREDGHDLDDWLNAEAELRQGRAGKVAA